jgi:flagellar biosynthesis component FlhA
MQKLIEQIKEYLPEMAFLAVLVKCLYAGTGIGESLFLVSVVVLMGYQAFLKKEKESLSEKFQKQLDEINKKVTGDLEDIKSKVNSLSIEKLRVRNSNEEIPVNKPATPKRLF